LAYFASFAEKAKSPKSPKAFHLQMGTMMIGATDSGKSELTRGLATAFGSLDSQLYTNLQFQIFRFGRISVSSRLKYFT